MANEEADISVVGSAGGAGQGGYSSLHHGHSLGWAFTSGRLAGRAAAFAR
jgi:hypothetical protein